MHRIAEVLTMQKDHIKKLRFSCLGLGNHCMDRWVDERKPLHTPLPYLYTRNRDLCYSQKEWQSFTLWGKHN